MDHFDCDDKENTNLTEHVTEYPQRPSKQLKTTIIEEEDDEKTIITELSNNDKQHNNNKHNNKQHNNKKHNNKQQQKSKKNGKDVVVGCRPGSRNYNKFVAMQKRANKKLQKMTDQSSSCDSNNVSR
jgi:hypothetical protein